MSQTRLFILVNPEPDETFFCQYCAVVHRAGDYGTREHVLIIFCDGWQGNDLFQEVSREQIKSILYDGEYNGVSVDCAHNTKDYDASTCPGQELRLSTIPRNQRL